MCWVCIAAAVGGRYSQTGEDHVVHDELQHLLQQLRDEVLCQPPPATVIMPHLDKLFATNNEQCDFSSYLPGK